MAHTLRYFADHLSVTQKIMGSE